MIRNQHLKGIVDRMRTQLKKDEKRNVTKEQSGEGNEKLSMKEKNVLQMKENLKSQN